MFQNLRAKIAHGGGIMWTCGWRSVEVWCADNWCHAVVPWIMTIDITAQSGRKGGDVVG